MDEQEVDWDERIRDIKRRIAELKEEVGYYEKGEVKCSQESKTGSQASPKKPKDSLDKIKASLMRSALDV